MPALHAAQDARTPDWPTNPPTRLCPPKLPLPPAHTHRYEEWQTLQKMQRDPKYAAYQTLDAMDDADYRFLLKLLYEEVRGVLRLEFLHCAVFFPASGPERGPTYGWCAMG